MLVTTFIRRALAVGCVSMSVAALLPAQDAAKDVTKLEEQWITYSLKKDGAGLGKMLADNYLGITSEGKLVDKAWTVKDMSTDTTHYVSMTYSDLKANVHGNTVVIRGITNITTKGAKADVKLRNAWTDTWVKQADGKWLCVASQGTTVK
jgi:ketosteroid isomerase-like protein